MARRLVASVATTTSPAQRSWRSALMLGGLIELAFMGLVFLIVNSPSGPDSPLPFLMIGLLQFPSSLIVVGLLAVIPSEHNLTDQALWLYAALMFLGQTLLLGVWLRKPWRTGGAAVNPARNALERARGR